MQLEQNTLKIFFCFFFFAVKPHFYRVSPALAAETVVAQKPDSAFSAGLWLFHSFFQLVVVLAAVRPVTALSAAFFLAPLQLPTLVWRSIHRDSGGITAGSRISNILHSFVVSSI